MALTGSNGDNVTNIGMSKSISYSIYDENNNEIPVSNQLNPLDFWIAKDSSVQIDYSFKYIDVLNAQNQSQNENQNGSIIINGTQLINGFLVTGYNLTGANISLSIQIKPINKQLIYLALLKFGQNPFLNSTYKLYDYMNIFCPNDLVNSTDQTYSMFLNMSRVNGHKGYVGLSIRELNLTASNINCFNKSSLNSLDKILIESFESNKTFSSNFWLRTYASGCYYMNTLTNEWSSNGMEILSDTNLTHTHCTSNHLTTFAGGFIVLPNEIDFNNVWANASFLQNPIIYSTVIALLCLYVLFGIWARYMDSKDSQKVGITLLGCCEDGHLDSTKRNKFIYEIIVFTGNRLNAGTSSKVC